MRNRRLSTALPNVQRRLTNRFAKVVAGVVIALAVAAWQGLFAGHTSTSASSGIRDSSGLDALIAAHQDASSVEVSATVARVLADDKKAPRHQRFTIELASGDHVLVAHNIDIAERVSDLHKGDAITLRGEFIWNDKGGVLHWTHLDPGHRHADGWIEHDGRRYQ